MRATGTIMSATNERQQTGFDVPKRGEKSHNGKIELTEKSSCRSPRQMTMEAYTLRLA